MGNSNIKSAVIVAGVILVIAIVIGVIYTSSQNKDTKEPKSTSVATAQVSNGKNESEPASVVTPNQGVSTSFVTIDANSLPTPSCTDTIGIVQNKSIRLEGHELFFCLDLLVGSENLQLSYIVGESGYNAVAVGDKLTVKLATYTTDNGSVFYLVQGVQTIE